MEIRRSIPPGLGLFIIIAVQIGGFALLWGKDAPPPQYVYLPNAADKQSTDSSVNTPVVVVSPPDEKALRELIRATLEKELEGFVQRVVVNPASKNTRAETKDIPSDPQVLNEAECRRASRNLYWYMDPRR